MTAVVLPRLCAGDVVTVTSTKTLGRMDLDWCQEAGGACHVRVEGGSGSPRLVDRTDVVRGNLVDVRRLGPLLFRTSTELRVLPESDGDGGARARDVGDARLTFVSCYGVKAERTLLLHAVEPRSLSVSVWPLGEPDLRALVDVADPGRGRGLLERWLGPPDTPVTHKRRLSRAEWTTVLAWLTSRLALVRDGVGLVLSCRDLERAYVDRWVRSLERAAVDDTDAPGRPTAPEAPDLEDIADQPIDCFALEAYDRICVAAGDSYMRGGPPKPETRNLEDYGLSAYDALRDDVFGDVAEDSLAGQVDALRPEDLPVVARHYEDVREAALSALEFEEVRKRKQLPLPNPRPFSQHLVIESRIDAIERDLERRLQEATANAERLARDQGTGLPVFVS